MPGPAAVSAKAPQSFAPNHVKVSEPERWLGGLSRPGYRYPAQPAPPAMRQAANLPTQRPSSKAGRAPHAGTNGGGTNGGFAARNGFAQPAARNGYAREPEPQRHEPRRALSSDEERSSDGSVKR
eukprot:Skav225359  [mRNA]  locus=scaffold3158:7474:9917:- [translate_table: standard]